MGTKGKCPNCRESIYNLADHEQRCPERRVPCRYLPMGCHHQCKIKELANHEKNKVAKHLELVTVYTARLDLLVCEQRKEIDTLRSEGQTMQNDLSSLKETTRRNSLQIAQFQSNAAAQSEDILSLKESKVDRKDVSLLRAELSRYIHSNTTASLNSNQEILAGRVAEFDHSNNVLTAKCYELTQRLESYSERRYDGRLLWKISNVSSKLHESENLQTSINSFIFSNGHEGYCLQLRLYLNGCDARSREFISLALLVVSGQADDLLSWPCTLPVEVGIVNQAVSIGAAPYDQQQQQHYTKTINPLHFEGGYSRQSDNIKPKQGGPSIVVAQINQFAPHTIVFSPASPYVVNDIMYIRCRVLS